MESISLPQQLLSRLSFKRKSSYQPIPKESDVELCEKLLPNTHWDTDHTSLITENQTPTAAFGAGSCRETIHENYEEDSSPGLPKGKNLVIAFYISLNVLSSIAIVFLNKIIVRDGQLRNCQLSFAAFHLFVTFLVLLIASLRPFSMFPAVRLPVLQIMPLCGLFAGFLVLGNLSLEYNTVAFYQLAKMLTGPCVVVLNFFLFRETISRLVLISVSISTAGVIIANGAFGLTHPLGAGIATAALMVTAVYQIWIKKNMVDLNVSAPQLLLNQAPVAVLLLLVLVPVFDTMPDLQSITPNVWFALFASAAVASMINLSQFLTIGATSALTFNIIGAFKTIGILSIGWTVARKTPTVTDIGGMLLALGGTGLYAHAASKPAKP